MGIPVLGICYGMQFMVSALGGTVNRSKKREYGFAQLSASKAENIFTDITQPTQCWMSHGDSVKTLPRGFVITGSTDNTPMAAMAHIKKRLFGVQFHPEVEHTTLGKKILHRFLIDICDCKRNWTMRSFAKKAIADIRDQVGSNKVILGLSGGVDSSVTALLLHQAIGRQLTCIFVDNGLLRLNEADKLKQTLRNNLNINIRFVSARRKFLSALSGVTDPEKKRKIIGNVFMQVFEAEAKKIKEGLVFGPGYPLPRCDRVGLRLWRTHRGDQVPSQCWWPSQKDETQAGGTAALSL